MRHIAASIEIVFIMLDSPSQDFMIILKNLKFIKSKFIGLLSLNIDWTTVSILIFEKPYFCLFDNF